VGNCPSRSSPARHCTGVQFWHAVRSALGHVHGRCL
jgi:hypothetical protein